MQHYFPKIHPIWWRHPSLGALQWIKTWKHILSNLLMDAINIMSLIVRVPVAQDCSNPSQGRNDLNRDERSSLAMVSEGELCWRQWSPDFGKRWQKDTEEEKVTIRNQCIPFLYSLYILEHAYEWAAPLPLSLRLVPWIFCFLKNLDACSLQPCRGGAGRSPL